MQNENWIVSRKIAWLNTKLLSIALFLLVNLNLFVLLKKTIYQMISFLLISLFTLVIWIRWNKLIKDLI